MKNRVINIVAIVFLQHLVTASHIQACEVCGCGIGGPTSGLSPYADKTYFSVRQRTFTSESHLNSGQRFLTNELFLRYDIQARIALVSDLIVQTSVPYSFNSQQYVLSGDRYSQSGFGDIVVTASWIAYNKKIGEDDSSNIGGSVLITAGVSVPTGSYTYDSTSIADVANANFQLGSGSVDPIVGITATLRDETKGLRANAVVRYPTTNSMNYRFGESALTMLSAFTEFKTDIGRIIPSVGILGEFSARNASNKMPIDVTGGYGILFSAACTFQYNSVLLDIQCDVPLKQSYGSGALNYGIRSAVSLGVLL